MKTLFCVALLSSLFAGSAVAQAPRSAREAYEIHRAFTAKPDSNGVYEYVEQMPEFDVAGGSVNSYIAAHLTIPNEALEEAGFSGNLVVAFVVNPKGAVVDSRIARSGGKSADAALLKVVRGMARWKPGLHLGKAVPVYMRIPVRVCFL